MRIKVTADHIKRGKANDCLRCPIALAMSEAYGRKFNVGDFFFSLPPKAEVFIHDFDRGRPVKPFSFELRKVKR